MKEDTGTQTIENPVDRAQGDSKDLRELEASEINLKELAQRHDWREILRDIVRKEDMDPWNVKVSKLVEEYISTVRKMEKMDYRVPANAMLASSILLREKSNSWVLRQGDEEEESVWDNIPMTPDQIPPPREKIPEPKPKKRETKRKVSLDELIGAVDQVIEKEKEKAREKAKSKEPKEVEQDLIPDHFIEMAKEEGEDFEKKIQETEEKVKNNLDEENLTSFKKVISSNQKPINLIETLVSLLHLAGKGKISIWQEEVFGEIFIHYLEGED